jgi:hypothetical protein
MYELWDVQTANRIGAYRSERAALRDVADTVRRYGLHSAEALNLGLLGPGGLVASGAELVRRAQDQRSRRRTAA